MPKGPHTLSPREKAFARAYVTSANADPMVAALHAGYQGSQDALRKQGQQLLRYYRVRHAIDRRLRRAAAGPGAILKEVSEVAMAPWRDFLEIRRDEDGEIIEAKLKLSDKLRAAEMLLKVQGQLTDPASRLMDQLMKQEILAMMRAQREQQQKQLRSLAKRAREKRRLRAAARVRQLALPAGSPGGPPLQVEAQRMDQAEPILQEHGRASASPGRRP